MQTDYVKLFFNDPFVNKPQSSTIYTENRYVKSFKRFRVQRQKQS